MIAAQVAQQDGALQGESEALPAEDGEAQPAEPGQALAPPAGSRNRLSDATTAVLGQLAG